MSVMHTSLPKLLLLHLYSLQRNYNISSMQVPRVIQGTTDPTKAKEITLTDGNKISSADFGVFVGANYSEGGKYLLGTHNLADLVIDTDAGTAAQGGAFINIAAQVSGLEIHIGEIGVTASGTQGTATSAIRRGGDTTNYNAILSGLGLKTGQLPSGQRFLSVRHQGRQVYGYLHGSVSAGRCSHGHPFR